MIFLRRLLCISCSLAVLASFACNQSKREELEQEKKESDRKAAELEREKVEIRKIRSWATEVALAFLKTLREYNSQEQLGLTTKEFQARHADTAGVVRGLDAYLFIDNTKPLDEFIRQMSPAQDEIIIERSPFGSWPAVNTAVTPCTLPRTRIPANGE